MSLVVVPLILDLVSIAQKVGTKRKDKVPMEKEVMRVKFVKLEKKQPWTKKAACFVMRSSNLLQAVGVLFDGTKRKKVQKCVVTLVS